MSTGSFPVGFDVILFTQNKVIIFFVVIVDFLRVRLVEMKESNNFDLKVKSTLPSTSMP